MARLPRPLSLLLLLLCAPLSAPLSPADKLFGLDRCALDVACVATDCSESPISFKIFTTDFDELTDCNIVVMIKKLNATRYTINLHINDDNMDDINLSLGSLAIKLETGTEPEDTDENNFIVGFEPIKFNAKSIEVIIDANIQDMSVSSERYLLNVTYTYGSDQKRHFHDEVTSEDENEIAEAIENTLTCTPDAFSDLQISEEYEVEPLDFSALELKCPPGFKLVVSLPNKPLKTLESTIKCEDKKWQVDMNGNYFHDHDWTGYINGSKLDGPLSDREVQFTIVEKMSIGCARKICSLCLVVPPPFPNCTDCEKAFVKLPRNDFECAALTCKYPLTQIFTEYGKYKEADGKRKFHVDVDPVCRKGEKSKSKARWHNDVNDALIENISCYTIPKADNDKENEGGNETDHQPSHHYGKVDKSKKRPKTLEPKAGVGDWLKNNWVSSILVPLIIIGIIGGCIIFLVVMVRTKDEQDQLHRQGLRMEEDIREGNCGSVARSVRTSVSNSRSDEALV